MSAGLGSRLAALLACLSIAAVASAADVPVSIDTATISGIGIRNIGSATMSGRIAAVAGRLNDDGKATLFVGTASGGVWRSLDGGTTFKPVFDRQSVQSIGAVALDPSRPNIVWAGTGEAWTRNSASIGDGIYKSTDNGDSWTHMGLVDSERIAKIIVHPIDSDIVYACVPGKLWSDSAARGLYKTVDGGKSWTLVFKGDNLSTGCSSIAMDPKDPEHMFAALWDFRRQGWTFRSGGESPETASGSGLFVTGDGGKSWRSLDAATARALPPKPWGRSAIAIAPSDPKRVYVVIEAVRSALFVSEDGGGTFEERDRSQAMVWRPFYFANLVVDPKAPDRVFKTNYNLIVSTDGGKTFSATSAGAHGDWHDLWINPQNPMHLVGGDDGGLWTSFDGGTRWWKNDNLPVSQFYHVSVDDADPYQVYGGLQDNAVWVGDSAYPGGISNSRWEPFFGCDGFWAFADPVDTEYLYGECQGGFAGRVNRKTHETRDIQPKAGAAEKLRFNWNTPLYLSPSQKGTLYIGAQFLFRSRDQGQSWERISPDLTTNDPEKQKQEQAGGITVDNSAAEMHTTIYSISESPKNPRVLWIGTDDGNVQLTRDGGKSWKNVGANLPGVSTGSWVSWVEASRFDVATAYVAVDRHTFGDMQPYLFRTADYGATWTRVAGPDEGLRGYVHVLKEDSVNPDLLFVGTELGLWISTNRGAAWAQFKPANFPAVAVRDIALQTRDNDLVLATHGRGIWVIDDITPLRHLNAGVLAQDVAFVASRPVQQRITAEGGWVEGDAKFVGENPADGAVITYYQRQRHLFGTLKLEILDAAGKSLDVIPASKHRGLNRVAWSMRVKPPVVPPAAQLARHATRGPRLPPGTYTVRLTKADRVYESRLLIGLDRRAKFTVADRRAQFDAAMRVHSLFGDMTQLVGRINATREALQRLAGTLPPGDTLRKDLELLEQKADTIRKQIVATKEGGAITGEERLREHTDLLYGAIMSWEGRPTVYQLDRTDVLRAELAKISGEFDALLNNDLSRLNDALTGRRLPRIDVPERVAVMEAALRSVDAQAAIRAAFALQ
ncbi:MAG: sialidase [Betaproteobacteria bacterium]